MKLYAFMFMGNYKPEHTVVWDNEEDTNYNGSSPSALGRTYGHVSISDGNGKEHSDKTWNQTVTRDQKYYVFMPVKNPVA